MSHYRGYYIDHIVAPAIIEATDDAQAMLKASELLSTSQFLRIEVWHEFRLVGALSAPAPSHRNGAKDDPHASEEGVSSIVELRSR